MRSFRIVSLGSALILGLLGCSQVPRESGALPPPVVTVAYPVEKEVTDFNNFSGRTAAVESVRIRARVWGPLDKINFDEGAKVKSGDVLFEIDPKTYQTAVDQARGRLDVAQAQHRQYESESTRNLALRERGGLSQEDLDRSLTATATAAATVNSARADLKRAELDLEFTKVRAPVDGVVGRALVTVGNVVQSAEMGGTVLTTLVSVHPMYAYFDVDDQTYAPIKNLVPSGKYKSAPETLPPVMLGMVGEDGFPHTGVIDFVDNQVDPTTGTIKMRGVFANKDGALTPGLFVRVRVPLGRVHKAVLITDRAIDTDQGQKVMYVVNADNVVEKRDVELGRLHDGLREIKGVKPSERVIVDGIQRVRGGIPVEPVLQADKQTQTDKETKGQGDKGKKDSNP